MTNIGKVFKVGQEIHKTVGPQYDPYAQHSRLVYLKNGQTFVYVWCSLAGNYISKLDSQGRRQSVARVDCEPAELAPLGLPTHDEVERWVQRWEQKIFRKRISALRAQGLSRRQAIREIDHEDWIIAEMQDCISGHE